MEKTQSSLRHVGIWTSLLQGGSHRRRLTARGLVMRGVVMLALVWVALGIAVPSLLGHSSPGLGHAFGHHAGHHHGSVIAQNPPRPWMY